jgi:adenylate cyclase
MQNTLNTPSHSFIFVDIVGFTAITECEGDHRAAEIATTLVRVARLVASEEGAEVVKHIGDAVMLRTDGAHDALVLALRLRRELAGIPGFPAVHSGIHTGPAVCADDDWFGNTVNVASRIADAAEPGEILCSEATLAAAGAPLNVSFVACGSRVFRNCTPQLGVFSAERVPPRFTRRPAGTPLAVQVA